MPASEWQEQKQTTVARYGSWGSYDIVPAADGSPRLVKDDTQYSSMSAVFLAKVMAMVEDFLKKPWAETSIIDIACMEGWVALECAMRLAKRVVGIDIREHHIARANCARDILGLGNCEFRQQDVRTLSQTREHFDVALALGILYHLEPQAVFTFIEELYLMTDSVAIIDTHIAMAPEGRYEYQGKLYGGILYTETRYEKDAPYTINEASWGNKQSLWLTQSSLLTLLKEVGFGSMYTCWYPRDGAYRGELEDRMMVVAVKSAPAHLRTLPDMELHGEAYRDMEFRLSAMPVIMNPRNAQCLQDLEKTMTTKMATTLESSTLPANPAPEPVARYGAGATNSQGLRE